MIHLSAICELHRMPFYLYLLSKFAAMYGTSIVSVIVVFVYLQQLSFRTCYGKHSVPKKKEEKPSKRKATKL